MTIEMQEKRKEIPSHPGVYFFKGPKGEILYVGKAVNLRQRLGSYFRESTLHTPAKIKMLEEATDITWRETESEIEALITEAFLIKRHRPRYNILMRDDKNYYFVAFTKENFPRVFLTHQPFDTSLFSLTEKDAGRKKSDIKFSYVGPFTEGASIKRVLRMLRRIFPYCTCSEKHIRLCQNAGLNLCLGDCCLRAPEELNISLETYKKNIASIKNILSGKHKKLVLDLEAEMERASEDKNFERAAKIRDQLFGLERIFAHSLVIKKDLAGQGQKALVELQILLQLKEIPVRIEGYDISNIQGNFAVGSMVVFTDGMPDKDEYRKFKIKTISGANDPAMINEVIRRRLTHPEWPRPNVMLIDGGKTQLAAALSARKGARLGEEKDMKIISIAKREEELYIPGRSQPLKLQRMPIYLLHLIQQIRDEAHRFAISYYRKVHRAKTKESFRN